MPSEKSESVVSKFASEFGLTIHELLRYAFAGTIAILVLTEALLPANSANDLKKAIEPLGAIGLTLVALSVGVVVYVMARQTLIVFSTCLLFWCWPFFSRFLGQGCEIRQEMLAYNFGLRFFDCEVAFFVLRSYRERDGTNPDDTEKPLWSGATQEQFYRQHSENHLVFSSAFVFLIAACAQLLVYGWSYSTYWHFMGFLFLFIFGTTSDAHVLKREGTILSEIGFTKIGEILHKAGLNIKPWTSESDAIVRDSDPNVAAMKIGRDLRHVLKRRKELGLA